MADAADILIDDDLVDADIDTDTPEPAPTRDLRTKVVHPLLFPIEVKSRDPRTGKSRLIETIEEVNIRRPTGADLEAIPVGLSGFQADRALMGPLTGLTDKQLKKMDAADLMDISDIIAGFVRPGRRSGATTSET